MQMETVKRYGLFVISLLFIGLGIALTKHAGLGISPISSVANVMSLKYTSVSFGTWVFLSNCTFLLGQFLLQCRHFKLISLLQLPLSILFGYFTDFGMWLVRLLPNGAYGAKLLLVLGGSIVLAFGIALSVIADVILNAAEAFVKALSETVKKDFSTTKVVFDVCWVAFSALLSLLLFNGALIGIREGTLISAFLVGFIVKLFRKGLQKPLAKLLRK